MPTIAEVMLRLRVDKTQLKRDIDDSLNRVDTRGAGTTAGRSFGRTFSSESSSAISKLFRGGNQGIDWSKLGSNIGSQMAGGLSRALSGAGGAISPALSNPYAAGGIFAALVTAAPFAGQAIAGGLVTGLGAGLAGIGVFAASKTKPVQTAFDHLKETANKALAQIGAPMVPVLQSILKTAKDVVTKLTPVFKAAEQIISGPLKQFVNTFLRAFTQPAVVTSIKAVANAFGAILKALAPSLPGLFREVANAITAIANNVAKNPGAFAAFVTFLVRVAVYGLNTVNALTVAATYIERHFIPAIKDIAKWGVSVAITAVKAFKGMADAVLNTIGAILHGIAPLANVPGFGWIRGVVRDFDNFHKHADDALNGTLNTLYRLQAGLNGTARTSANVSALITRHFLAQQHAANVAQNAVAQYSTIIARNGATSAAAGRARTILINDMLRAGVSANTARTDVSNYTNAVAQHGIRSDQARAARQRLINDILDASNKSKVGRTDMQNLVSSIVQHGQKSDQTRAARTRLINDLVKSGVSASTAKGLVDALQRTINGMHGKAINVLMTGAGSFKIVQSAGGQFHFSSVSAGGRVTASPVRAAAMGALIRQGTGPTADDVLVRVSRGELIVPAKMVSAGLVDHLRGSIPGFASGGYLLSDPVNSMARLPGATTSWANRFLDVMAQKMEGGMSAAVKSLISQAQAQAAAAAVGGGPLGGATGSELANGRQLYNYLLRYLFGGNKIAAAGATASIWGESTWNPFAVGTGGRGLIGWTPPSKISDATFRGGMRTQLPAIIQFVVSNGDMPAIREMERAGSVSAAAWIWGRRVERFGIPDVHPEGIRLATSFMAKGGTIREPVIGLGASGQTYMLGERGEEEVIPGSAMDALIHKIDRLIAAVEASPGRTAGGLAKAINGARGLEVANARRGAR